MPRTCLCCRSPYRSEIDRGIIAGETLHDIAQIAGVSRWSIRRHHPHAFKRLAGALKVRDQAENDKLVKALSALMERAFGSEDIDEIKLAISHGIRTLAALARTRKPRKPPVLRLPSPREYHLRNLALRLRAGDSRAAYILQQRQRGLMSAKLQKRRGWPNLRKAWEKRRKAWLTSAETPAAGLKL